MLRRAEDLESQVHYLEVHVHRAGFLLEYSDSSTDVTIMLGQCRRRTDECGVYTCTECAKYFCAKGRTSGYSSQHATLACSPVCR